MLALAEDQAGEFSDREAVEAAIWFHDAVYDTRSSLEQLPLLCPTTCRRVCLRYVRALAKLAFDEAREIA
jgi:hypothetical protein